MKREKPIKILHIDDNRLDRELIQEALSDSKYLISKAESKTEFYELIHEESFDLVLTDYDIMGFTGLEVLDVVKKIETELPVILITGTGSEEIAVEALKKGAADYIIKSPKHIRRLPNAIEAILNKKELEDELQQMQLHYTDFINSSSDIVSYWKVPENCNINLPDNIQMELLYDSVCVDSNRSAWELFGFTSKNEIVGKKYIDLISEKTFDEAFLNFISNGYQLYDYESHQILEDGNKVYTLHNWHGSVENGSLTYIWTSSKNITERKLAEEDRERLISAIEHSRDTIVITDSKGQILYANPEFENISGYRREEAIGRNPRILKSGMQNDDFYKQMWQLISKGETWRGRLVNKKKDGSLYTESASISPVFDENGAIINYVAVKRDITEQLKMEAEQKRMEEIMVQNEKMLSLGGLVAGMAYEINNPLAAIVQISQNIANRMGKKSDQPANVKAAEEIGIRMDQIKDYADSRGIFDKIESIIQSADKVTSTVDDLLSFATISNASKSLVNLDELIDETLAMITSDYDHTKYLSIKEFKIERIYETDLPPVLCESSKIQQVLINLFQNGAQAMTKAETENPQFIIRLRYIKESESFFIEIEDNGPGMSEDIRKRIFEPFYSTRAGGVGTGLGLSVSFFIITNNHKGDIWVESEPDAGSKFIIRLPKAHD